MTELLKHLKFEDCNTDEEIVNFWNRLGLIDGIENDFKKECVAKAMHTMTNKLLNEDKYANDDFPFKNFSVVIFPIIRRVIMDPYYKGINDFDVDFFEKIINENTFVEMLSHIAKDHYNKLLELDIYNTIKEVLNNKTIHDITQEDCEKLKEQNIDLEAECVALMAEYYVYRIKERDEEKKKKEEPKWLKETKKSIAKYPEGYQLGDRKIEDLTEADFDFQGFLIPHITLREGLMNIGFKEDKENNRFYIENDNKMLDTYPLILEDDGMGYGAKNRKMADMHISGEERGNPEIHICF